MRFTLLIIAAFIIWFSSLWVAILSILSFIGGWNALSRLYPLSASERNNAAVKYSLCSMKLGFVNYRSCANISFTETGVILEMMKIFTIMHKPLFIPYSRISGAEKGKFFTTYTQCSVENKKIVIYGKAGDELFARLQSR
jgi:hypothetical protein